FGKSAKKEPDAMPAVGLIYAHRTLDSRHGLAGAAEKSGVVTGKSMSDPEVLVHCKRLFKGPRGRLQLSCRRGQHPLDAFCHGIPRRHLQRDRDRFAPEVGRYGRGSGIPPPRIADDMLASESEADQSLHAPRIACEPGEVPSLSLGRELRAGSAFERF